MMIKTTENEMPLKSIHFFFHLTFTVKMLSDLRWSQAFNYTHPHITKPIIHSSKYICVIVLHSKCTYHFECSVTSIWGSHIHIPTLLFTMFEFFVMLYTDSSLHTKF